MTSQLTKKRNRDGETDEHESYGVITINRSTGNVNLFNVSSPQQHFIALSIRKACRYRSLSNDQVFAKEEIAEVMMSETQFARMLSSIGMGSGVPCTLNRIEGRHIGIPPQNNRGAKLKEDMKISTEYISDLLKEMDGMLKNLTESKTISKKKVREVQNRMYHARMEVDANMPFVLDQATEQLEGAINEARANIDAYQKHRAIELGISVISDSVQEIQEIQEIKDGKK